MSDARPLATISDAVFSVFFELLSDLYIMRSFRSFIPAFALFCLLGTASAQRHDAGSAPPTAPPPKQMIAPQPVPPDPINSGLGSLQFTTANLGVPAPESLASQLQSSDDRMRTAALAAIGAPSQYLIHGHVPFPRSVRLDFLALGSTPELDAILTVQLDQHLVSVILMPEAEEWHRIATVLSPLLISDHVTTLSTFLRTDRSLLDHDHYAAIFHAVTNGLNGDFTENETHLRILNGHAIVVMSFASTERTCDPTHQHPCDLTERWLQPDTTSPDHQLLLVTATGHIKPAESEDPLAHSETFETSRLRTFTCQPFVFSDTTLHLESSAAPTACIAQHEIPHEPSTIPVLPPKN